MSSATMTRPRSAVAGQVGFGPSSPAVVDRERVHIGFDLGSRMGYAALDDRGQRLTSGVWVFEPVKNDPGARWVRVANTLGRWLQEEVMPRGRVSTVGYEVVHRHEGVLAAHVYGGMEAMLLAQCSRLGLSLERVEVADLKLVATGKGNAAKLAVMVSARERWRHLDVDAKGADNEADSLWVAEIVRRRVLGVAL